MKTLTENKLYSSNELESEIHIAAQMSLRVKSILLREYLQ